MPVFSSNMLNFGSSKPVNPETENSFLSLISSPPLLQYDFPHQSNLKASSSGSSYPDQSGLRNANVMGNWPLLHNNGNLNVRDGRDVQPVFPCKPPMSATNRNNRGIYDNLDSRRAFVNHTDFRTEGGCSTSLQKGPTCSPSSNRNGEVHALTNSIVLDASMQRSASVSAKPISFVSGSPRVFCMSACGDLLLSNTGLFGVFCSCHCVRMSVSKFCEHSGIFDANPGYAVRMESGDCIAQWRKVYLQKFGIMAPEDHIGWDWPEGIIPASNLANNKMAVGDRKKVFDLSSLFSASAESTKSKQPWKNVSVNRALSGEGYGNLVSKGANQKYGCEECTMHTSLGGSSRTHSHTIPENSCRTAPAPSCLTASEVIWREKLQIGSQSSYSNFKANHLMENSAGPAVQLSQNISCKTQKNSKDSPVLWGGNLPSSMELKLGQPSHLGWGSTSPSALKAQFSNVRATPVQEKLIGGISKFTQISSQHNHHRTTSDWSRTKEQLLSGLVDNSHRTAHGVSQVVTLQDRLSNCSTSSVPVSSSSNSVAGVMSSNKINTAVIDTHSLIPSALRYQPSLSGSSTIDLSCNGNKPTRLLDSNQIALQKQKHRTAGDKDGNTDFNFGSGSSFKHYAKQMETFGLLTSYDRHPNVSRIPAEEVWSVGMPTLLSGISGASACIGKTLSTNRDRLANELKTSSLGFRTNPSLQTVSTSVTSLTTVLSPGCGFSFSKGSDVASPCMSGEGLRDLTLKNIKQPVNVNPQDASFGLDQQQRTISEQRTHSVFSVSGVPDSFSNKEPLEGQKDKHNFSVGYNATPTCISDVGHDKAGALTLNTTDDNQGACELQHDERCQNKASNCTVLQRGFQGPYPNRENHCKSTDSVDAFQKQFSVVDIGSPIFSCTIRPDVCVPLKNNTPIVCNQNEKQQKHAKLISFGSQWRDVPSRSTTGSKRRCLENPMLSLETKVDPEAHFKMLHAEGTARFNQAADVSKEKDVSIYSGCSTPAITEASSEVNKNDSCTVNGGNTGYANDQVVDQGSVIMKNCSSDDTVDSVRSSQPVSITKPMVNEPISPILTHHGQNDENTQVVSKSNEPQNLKISEVSLDVGQECIDKTQSTNFDVGQECVENTQSTERLIAAEVSLLPAKCRLPAGSNVDCQTLVSESVQVLEGDFNGPGLKKRRSTLCQVKLFSHKRDLRGQCDFVDGQHNDQKEVKGGDESMNIPLDNAAKKLKRKKFNDAPKKHVKSSRCSLKSYTKPKPVACGKYGILRAQELVIDQLKPPKIVPLSQVLKAAKSCTQAEKESAAFLDTEMSNFRVSKDKKCLDVSLSTKTVYSGQRKKVLSCSDGDSDDCNHETQSVYSQGDEHFADEFSTLKEVGVDGRPSPPPVSYRPSSQLKANELRMRNLYELSMRGNKVISADLSLSQNVMCEPPKRNESEDAEETSGAECRRYDTRKSFERRNYRSLISVGDALCCVCGISNKDDFNCLLECGSCLIRIHQACYGISRVPKGKWFCRPCRTSSKDVVCVLCGYGGGAMTRAFGSRNVVKTLLKAWNIRTESHIVIIGSDKPFEAKRECGNNLEDSTMDSYPSLKPVVHNCIVAGLFNPTVKQWVHMVCGLWTSGTRCPNVDTMSAVDVSGVYYPDTYVVCYLCKRSGGSCIKCRFETCFAHFHPWCAHQKGLLQSEVEGVGNDKVGFYGRCMLHASYQSGTLEDVDNDVNKVVSDSEDDQEPTCARIEAYQGKKKEGKWPTSFHQYSGKGECLVSQTQLDAWQYINKHKLSMKMKPAPPISEVEHDYRKEYAQFKLRKGWKRLVVYKSGIHALGLYTSQLIPRGAMVVEYVGEIVGQRVADKREMEYLAGRRHQYKSACYFFRIDKEQIIDATCKGGIARFVNHSCQPNSIAKVITIRSQKKVVFFALKDIFPGEEITYDYHFSHEDEGKKIPCFCNSKICRRYLN